MLRYMLKKILLALVLIIIIFLIVPTPFRYGRIFCECKPGVICSCPKEGDIGWNQPFIIQLMVSVTNSR